MAKAKKEKVEETTDSAAEVKATETDGKLKIKKKPSIKKMAAGNEPLKVDMSKAPAEEKQEEEQPKEEVNDKVVEEVKEEKVETKEETEKPVLEEVTEEEVDEDVKEKVEGELRKIMQVPWIMAFIAVSILAVYYTNDIRMLALSLYVVHYLTAH